jgi:hypothetical protein
VIREECLILIGALGLLLICTASTELNMDDDEADTCSDEDVRREGSSKTIRGNEWQTQEQSQDFNTNSIRQRLSHTCAGCIKIHNRLSPVQHPRFSSPHCPTIGSSAVLRAVFVVTTTFLLHRLLKPSTLYPTFLQARLSLSQVIIKQCCSKFYSPSSLFPSSCSLLQSLPTALRNDLPVPILRHEPSLPRPRIGLIVGLSHTMTTTQGIWL